MHFAFGCYLVNASGDSCDVAVTQQICMHVFFIKYYSMCVRCGVVVRRRESVCIRKKMKIRKSKSKSKFGFGFVGLNFNPTNQPTDETTGIWLTILLAS